MEERSLIRTDETLEFACAVKTICDEYNIDPEVLRIFPPAHQVLSLSNQVRFKKRLVVKIPLTTRIAPEKLSAAPHLRLSSLRTAAPDTHSFYAPTNDTSQIGRLGTGLGEFELTKDGKKIRFWVWNGAQDYYIFGGPSAYFVHKDDVLALTFFIKRAQRQYRRPVDMPILPSEMITEIYKNSVGFLLKGRDMQEKYKKYRIPYKRGILFSGRPGCGKCVSLDTLVFTNEGILPIGNFVGQTPIDEAHEIETTIWNKDGERENAEQIYNGGWHSTVKIKTRFGFSLEGTLNHQIITTDGQYLTWKRLDELLPNDYIAIPRGMNFFGQTTDISYAYTAPGRSKVTLPKQMDENLAYFLGVLTGDGSLTTKNVISFHTAELTDKYTKLLKILFNAEVLPKEDKRCPNLMSITIGSVQIKGFLQLLGMSAAPACKKSIPHAILQAPRKCVKAFLQGLFDTDGWADTTGRIGYDSCSENLAKEVHLILTNFGIISSLRFKSNECNGAWSVDINGEQARSFFETIGFSLARKQERISNLAKAHNTNFDIVPYDCKLIREEIKNGGPFPRKFHLQMQKYKNGTRKMSHQKAQQFISTLQTNRIGGLQLKELCNPLIFWDQIKSISHAENQVADFYVPNSHSFAGGGFLNHNTLSCRWLRELCEQNSLAYRVITMEDYREAQQRGGVRRLFKLRGKRSGIIFFDDMDVMVKDRKKSGGHELSTFLSELDGLDPADGVVYVFTTNYIKDLDEAFVRPGRIDLWLPFQLPTTKLRRKFIDQRFDEEIKEQADSEDILKRTKGYSFAELEEIRKLFCMELIDEKSLNVDTTFEIFDKHRKDFEERAILGFTTLEDDDEDGEYGDENDFPDVFMPRPARYK